jgi:hypothetical protein
MNTFFKNRQSLSQAILSIRLLYIYIYIIFLICNVNWLYSQSSSQIIMCGYRMDTSMPFKAPGNFIPAGPKCFKLNPHFLNNSSDPIEKLPNNFFNFILDKLNSEFGPYNITFTYGDNCPKIKSITTKVETDTDLAGVFFPVGSAPSEFDWDPNSINIYFFQKELNIASGSNRQLCACKKGSISRVIP